MVQLLMVLLCGDIGASNSRLAIIDDRFEVLAKDFLKNSQFKNFSETIEAFLKNYKGEINGACFGVAGPVINDEVEITNLSWNFRAKEISSLLKIKKTCLINDLEAIAYGISTLDPNQRKIILQGSPQAGTQAVIAPGSGIGESILYWDGKKHIPLPTEGGHSSFSPTSPLQLELLTFLNRQYKHVSWERVLSGPGILNIYQFFCKKMNAKVKYQSSADITGAALEQHDDVCLKTVELFLEILANESGNLALKCLPHGGVFIAGGITPKIQKLLDPKIFLKNFTHKGRMGQLLEKIQVTLVSSEDVGIMGAAHYFLKNARF